VNERELVVGGIPSRSLHHTVAVDDAVRLDQVSGQDHPSGTQGVLGPVVVPGSVVPVPDQLDPIAHETTPFMSGGSDAMRNAGYAIPDIAYRKTGAAAATPVSLARNATIPARQRTIRT